MKQTSNTILLIRPSNFGFNVETAISNVFQQILDLSSTELNKKVSVEFENFAASLIANDLNVIVVNDTVHPVKPDAIFPNNWVSFHENGIAILYPMCTPNRRKERREDVLKWLSKKYDIRDIVDFTSYEEEGKYLEGTGSIVFDHIHKLAYAGISPRTNKEVLLAVCNLLNYEPIWFNALDENNKEIYHTNVMMSIGDDFALVCLESIKDVLERKRLEKKLTETGHQIIDISYHQMNNFAGNMLSLVNNKHEKLLVCSQSAFDSLSPKQKLELEKHTRLLPIAIPTIETVGGGSARCMIAEIFCHEKQYTMS